MWGLLIALNLFLVANADAGYFSTKCRLSDQDCVSKTAQSFIPTFTAGIPEIGLEPSDPLILKHVDASNNLLKLILTDVNITGFRNTVVKKIRYDEAKSTALLKMLFNTNLEGQYEMSGNLLFLPLEGKGPLHCKLRKMEINLLLTYKEIPGKDGKPHWVYEYKSHTYSLKDKSYVEFENLFNGNELLAKTAKEVIAQSGNEIILEVGPPVIKAVIDAVIRCINKFFEGVSVDEARA